MDSSIRRSNTVRISLSIVALLFFPLLGFILANVLYQASSEGTFVNWHSLGKPAEGVVDIVGGNLWTVWWESQDGQIYEGDIENCRNGEEGCWRKSESIEPFDGSKKEGPECESAFSDIKRPPGSLLKCFTALDVASNWYGETHYALLEDGSIWYWKYRFSGGLSGLFFGSHEVIVCGGIFMGLFMGLLTSLYLRSSKKASSTQ